MGLPEWFNTMLEASECAAVKRFYFNPIELEHEECSKFNRFIWMCRIITADQRLIWENLSNSFTTAFKVPNDLWNEQLAVKLLRTYLESISDDDSVFSLRDELEKHLNTVIKPPTSLSFTINTNINEQKSNKGEVKNSPYRIIPATEGVEGSIVCNAPLKSFSELLRVPREKLFYFNTVIKYCELGRVVHNSPEISDLLTSEEPLLVLSLIYERYIVSTSHWQELLLSCPSSYPTVPSFWEWDDLAELEGLDVLDDILAKRSQLMQFHKDVMLVLPLIYDALKGSSGLKKEEFLAHFTIETIMWARATFDSRAFNLNIDGKVVLALVPVADMINHSNYSDVLVRKVEPNEGDFVMEIGANLTKENVGHELWMSYGPLQNWELLQFYGFVIKDNEHDKLPFPLDLPKISIEENKDENNNDEWDLRRAALVKKYSLNIVGRYWINYNGCPPPALIALLRIHLAEAQEFDMMECNSPFTKVGKETEAQIISTISDTVSCILELSGTTLEEDEKLLEEATQSESDDTDVLSTNKRLCILLRIGLKRIAYRTLKWCNSSATEILNN